MNVVILLSEHTMLLASPLRNSPVPKTGMTKKEPSHKPLLKGALFRPGWPSTFMLLSLT